MTDRKNAIAFKGNEFEYRISSTGSNEAPTRFPFVHLQHGRFAMYVRDGRHARKRVSQKPPADLRQQDGQRARISAGEISTCARHRRKPARADCRHGEFFRDFWQAVYGERKGDPRGQAERRDEEGGGRAGGRAGTMVCTAVGRWVRSVSTVRELDRASGPLVGPVPTRLHTYARVHAHARMRTRASVQLHRSCTDTELPRVALRFCTNALRAIARTRARAIVCVRERHAPGFAVYSPGEVHRPPSLRQGQRKYSLARFVRSPRSPYHPAPLALLRGPPLPSPLRCPFA